MASARRAGAGRAVIAEVEGAEAEPWDGIRDAFSPVRDLVTSPRRIAQRRTPGITVKSPNACWHV